MRAATAAAFVAARARRVEILRPPRRLAANALWMLGGHGARAVIQGLYFIILARSLGAAQFGAFAGATALVAILGPFGSLGGGNLLVKHVARDPARFGLSWGNALVRTAAFGSLLLGLALVVSHYALPTSVGVEIVVLVALSDLLFLQVLDLGAKAFQAFERLSWTARLEVALPVARLGAAAVLALAIDGATALDWARLYLCSSVAASAFAAWAVSRELGRAVIDIRAARRELGEGALFSVGLSAQGVYNDIDKTILSRLAGVEATGIYAAAYRVVDVAFTPVRAVLYASYARFFRSGAHGIDGTLALAKPLATMSAVYGIAAGGALYLAAPALPWLLGEGFADSTEAVRWLALLPLLKVLHYFAADSLTGAGLQGVRSAGQVAIAAFNVAVNLWLIPAYGWRGAACASLLSDGMLALSLWLAVRVVRGRCS